MAGGSGVSIYGLLISIGGIFAFLITEKAAKQQKLNLKTFYIVVNLALIGGLLGARAWHVIDYWNFYGENPGQIWAVWKGGLGIFGGLLGGGLTTFMALLIRKEREQLLQWMDVLVLGLPLAQAIGRWGNFFNKEIYGIETTLPWGILIEGRKHHPLFLYESLLNLLLFFVLQLIWKRKETQEGTIFAVYTLGYVLIRILLQPLRI